MDFFIYIAYIVERDIEDVKEIVIIYEYTTYKRQGLYFYSENVRF